MRQIRSIMKKSQKNFFKFNILNQKLKTLYSIIQAFTLGTTWMHTNDISVVNVQKIRYSLGDFRSHFSEWGKSRNWPKSSKNDVTYTNFNCKAVEVTKCQFQEWTQVVRIINGDDELKKHSRTSPDVQFKEFSLTKQKTRPITDY